MRYKFTSTLIFIFLLYNSILLAQCPVLDQYSQGNGGPTNCPKVGTTPYDTASFLGTSYATIPTSSKTGNFTAYWSSSPSPTPAIAGFYQGTTKMPDTAGPAGLLTFNGSTYSAKYCFYGSQNLPNSGKLW